LLMLLFHDEDQIRFTDDFKANLPRAMAPNINAALRHLRKGLRIGRMIHESP